MESTQRGLESDDLCCAWVCAFCSRCEAACQDERTGIYLRDLNSITAPSFLSLLLPHFLLLFRHILFWDWGCSNEAARRVSVLCLHVCFGRLAFYHRGFLVLFFWQRKLPSEWDSKKPTCHSMSVCMGPRILNSLLYVCEFLCAHE